jgi:type VI secretion system secreted protein Hcp
MKMAHLSYSISHLAANRLKRAAALLFLASFATVRSQAAFDMFLKFYPENGPALVGESQDKTYSGAQGWFEISSFNLGIQNSVAIGSSGGGAGAGKAQFQDFTFTKAVDTISPAIFKVLASGSHFANARLVLRKAGAVGGKTQAAYLQYEFELVAVSSQHWAGSAGDDQPTESITLKVGAVKISYSPQKPDGTLGQAITGTWSQVLNSNVFDPLPDGP